jgi:hypothetical protein
MDNKTNEEQLKVLQITELRRIADALELVIQMVKKDQEETKARFEERWDKEDKEAAQ